MSTLIQWLQQNQGWLFQWWLWHSIALIAFMFIVERWRWRLFPFILYGKQLDLFMLLGGIVDVTYNWTWGTVEFLWPPQLIHAPREITFSQRLQHYKAKTRWWQFWHRLLATLICVFIEMVLPDHCKGNNTGR